LFDEGAQILFFPAPISCLGERYLPAAISLRSDSGKAPMGYPAAHSMSRIIRSLG
jgi:hypothetical protein